MSIFCFSITQTEIFEEIPILYLSTTGNNPESGRHAEGYTITKGNRREEN